MRLKSLTDADSPTRERGNSVLRAIPRLRVAFICGLLLANTAAPAYAARLVRISVEQDGKLILESHSGDDGFETPYLVWRQLKGAQLTPVNGFSLAPDPGEADSAVLRGRIIVDVQYGDRVETNELPLVLAAGKWHVEPAWVESHGPVGNLAEEQKKTDASRMETLGRDLRFSPRWLALSGFAAIVVLCLILVLIVAISWRRPGPASNSSRNEA